MIVITRDTVNVQIVIEIARRKGIRLEYRPDNVPNELRFHCPDEDVKAVRTWFAHDDFVLWFGGDDARA